jgi:hypothetical protein
MIGTGFIMYGKKASQMIPMGAGAALMVCPYLIPNLPAQIVVCSLLTALPFFIHSS